VRPHGPPDWPVADPLVEAALSQVYTTGNWGRYHGPECGWLEERLKSYFSCEHVQLCCSGTSGIELALRGCRVGPGDEVIMAAYDYKANFQDIVAIGATPVLVDISADDGQLDTGQLIDAITDQTKAVLCSHLHGGIVDMPRVHAIVAGRGVAVVEDACQATGGIAFGRKTGLWGDVGVISFGGSKLLTAGRGGAVFGNSADIMQRIRLYEFRGNHTYPLSAMQAAVLIPQLSQLDQRNARRTESVRHLINVLDRNPVLSLLARTDDSSKSAWYKVGFRYQADSRLNRELFCRAMRAEGIAMDPGFEPLHQSHSRRRFRAVGELPCATAAGLEFVTLHHPVLLEGETAIEQITAAIHRIQEHADQIIR
jgi:perosamine synthetase